MCVQVAVSQNAKVDTQTGLMEHREASSRDVCISVVHPTIVGMSETAAKGNTTYANCVRRFFRCFDDIRSCSDY